MGKHITLGQYFNLLKIANLEFKKKYEIRWSKIKELFKFSRQKQIDNLEFMDKKIIFAPV